MPLSIRWRRNLAIASFVVSASLILNLALWILYRNTQSDLEDELGRRLENVALVLSTTLDHAQIMDAWLLHGRAQHEAAARTELLTDPQVTALRRRMGLIIEAAELVNITLYDPSGSPFMDLAVPGSIEILPDPLAGIELQAALTGSPAHTPLYRSGSDFLMTGYAPVLDVFGQDFAVGVEADAQFFGGLQRLRRSLFIVGGFSLLLLVGFGFIFARIQTRLEHAEAAMQRSESLAAMGRMAAGIAHEIRNPLGIIRAAASRLKKRYDHPDESDEKFDFITDEVDRLNTILTRYLGFAKDEPAQRQSIDLVTTIERTLRMMQPELAANQVKLEVDLPDSCRVEADAHRMQQLTMNVILNGVQAMPHGGTLQVRMRVEQRHVELWFADSGPGIPPGVRQRVFEPFFTTKERGSGLGLAVVRRIVDQHGGTIALENGDSGGARVRVRLPIIT